MDLKREQAKIIIGKVREDKIENNCMSLDTLEKSYLEHIIKSHD